MFGGSSVEFLNENSVFDSKSPYGASKVFAHEITKIYKFIQFIRYSWNLI